MDLVGKFLAFWTDLRIALGTIVAIEGGANVPERHVMVGGEVIGETPQLGLWIRIETIAETGGTEWLGPMPPGMTERPVQLIRWEVLTNAYVFQRPVTAAQATIGFRTQ